MRRQASITISAIASLAIASQALAKPMWAKDSLKLQGNALSVVCDGQGPALDLARIEAINSCMSLAAAQLTQRIKITSLVVETDRESALHEEIETNSIVNGLNCDPVKEESQNDGSIATVWLMCRFDMSKVTVTSSDSGDKAKVQSKGNRYIRSSDQILSIATVPACDDILVTGKTGRVIRCTTNPINLTIHPGDDTLLLRATGYRPKTVDLRDIGGSRGTITVMFD